MTAGTAIGSREPPAATPTLTCRLCGSSQLRGFLDLGATPPCELFLTAETAQAPEATFPLHVRVRDACLLAAGAAHPVRHDPPRALPVLHAAISSRSSSRRDGRAGRSSGTGRRIAADRQTVLALPWNLRDELVDQLSYVREWDGRLVIPIPVLEIIN
jgi:hypothetical protein